MPVPSLGRHRALAEPRWELYLAAGAGEGEAGFGGQEEAAAEEERGAEEGEGDQADDDDVGGSDGGCGNLPGGPNSMIDEATGLSLRYCLRVRRGRIAARSAK